MKKLFTFLTVQEDKLVIFSNRTLEDLLKFVGKRLSEFNQTIVDESTLGTMEIGDSIYSTVDGGFYITRNY